jgi:hypothetical protein
MSSGSGSCVGKCVVGSSFEKAYVGTMKLN